MTSPLKIMDEIEQISLDRINHEAELVVTRKQWESLRTAIEAQAEELSRLHEYDKRLTEVMPTDFKSWHQNDRKEWPEVAALVITNIREREEWALDQLRQKDARIAQLELGLYEVHALADGVESSMEEIVEICRAWLKDSDHQSLARLKAEALREYAEHKREQAIEAGQGARRCRCNRMASNAEAYADRIVREVSRSSAKADEQEETHEGSLRENREAKEES